MKSNILSILVASLGVVAGQQVGTVAAEYHLPMNLQQCTGTNSCTTSQLDLTMDANWRWLHNVGGYTNCYTGNTWNAAYCPDPVSCAANCALDGVPTNEWASPYGVTQVNGGVQLQLVTQGSSGKNVGSRMFLLDGNQYKLFHLKNREFSFDVDVSNLPCGLNGAVYFVGMDADGGLSEFSGNKAGAAYGTGYCDSQCPRDIKFIKGEANILNWTPSTTDSNGGVGQYGSCCGEIDIWEANSLSAQYTMHPCASSEPVRCEGVDCGSGSDRYNGVCDKDGCDFGIYRLGNHTFFGPGAGYTIDTTKPFRVVTQFVTADGTDTGDLSAVQRFYVQNGTVYANPSSDLPGLPSYNSITDNTCTTQKTLFGDVNQFAAKGGLTAVGKLLDRGVVLTLSLWDDYDVNMLWLDSSYPLTSSPSAPGVLRGPCPTTSGAPANVESQYPNANVKYMNIAVGTIGSTFVSAASSGATAAPPTASPATNNPTPAQTTAASATGGNCATTVAEYGACTTAPGCCAASTQCFQQSIYYAQCLTSCPPSGWTCNILT